MRGTINATLTALGESANSLQTRETDGGVVIAPTGTPAAAGVLSTRTSASAGVIAVASTDVTTGAKAVLTWTDAIGDLKNRYNVDCVVAEVAGDSGEDPTYTVTVSGGSGDDLPDEDEDVNVALQVVCNITFDFDDVDTLWVTTNVRGVIVFMDATDTEKCRIDMGTKKLASWLKDSGFPAPISGTPVTYALIGSGDTSTTSFLPKVLCLYDSTYETSGT